jgi:hypothetical protein
MVKALLEATGLQRGCQATATFPWGVCWLQFPKPRRQRVQKEFGIISEILLKSWLPSKSLLPSQSSLIKNTSPLILHPSLNPMPT